MSSAEVLTEDRGAVRWITLNRPEVMNAITGTMLSELNETLKAADDDSAVRVIVMTGAGRAFCSGLDLKQAAAGQGIGGAGLATAGSRHFSTREICTVTLQRIDKPVIAAINGAAAGYGLDLALGCDMRVMSDKAVLMPGFARMGVVPESGGTWYLPRLLGWAKACEIAMLGDTLNAEESVAKGLANKAVPADRSKRRSLRGPKDRGERTARDPGDERLFRHGLTQDFESHSHHVLMSLLNLFKSQDFTEAVRSFAEKRPPQFKGG
jgi:enoyl-CoA hydratase/carnithine racemase